MHNGSIQSINLTPLGMNIYLLILIEYFRFLKLMLGIAVTCSNKQTFIGKIQSLDPTIQHTLTQCVASFIIIKVRILSLSTTLHVSHLIVNTYLNMLKSIVLLSQYHFFLIFPGNSMLSFLIKNHVINDNCTYFRIGVTKLPTWIQTRVEKDVFQLRV